MRIPLFGQSSSFRGLNLVPSKWRCLVPGERHFDEHGKGQPVLLIAGLREAHFKR